MSVALPPFGDAVVDLDDDDDDDGDDDDNDEGEGEGEEADDEDGDEDEDEEGKGEEELEYYREDGEEDQEDDNEEDSDDDDDDDEDDDDEDDDEHGGVGEEDEGEGEGEQAAAQDGKVTARAVAKATKSKPAEPGEDGAVPPEESDSEDEMPVNTIGNVPLEWYDDFDHVGYDLDGQKILRGTRKDELDALIARFDDPNASRTVHDYLHGVDVVLSEADIALIKRLQKRRYVDPNMNPYPEMVHYEYADKLHPLSSKLPAKAGFVPSRWEAKQVMRLVMAMRSEQYQKAVENRRKQDAKLRPDYTYLIWDDKGAAEVKHHKRLPPPKMPLPGNAESYNPPAEYLFTPEEKAAWEAMDPSDRPSNFVPQQYAALRQVPLYDNLIKERFERCLDLYLCPREIKQRLNIDPDSLLPQLPKPAELRPFPERLSFSFEGHTGRVYSVSVSPTGEHLLTASADGTVRLWEVATARCERTWSLGGEVRCVAFCPNADLDLAAAIVGSQLLLFLPKARPGDPHDKARALLSRSDGGTPGGWVDTDEALRSEGVMWRVTHVKAASMVTWHHGGDYLASVCPEGATKAVLLHQVSKRSTGSPFAKSKGRIETVAFHPSKCAQPPHKSRLLPTSLASSPQALPPAVSAWPGLGGLCRGREYCSDSTERLRASRADAANPHNSEAQQPTLFADAC
jgi:ribosome biogenesis protein ERB1